MKKILVLLAIILILSISNVFAITFSDVSGHWGESYIVGLADKGIINGYSDGTFRPNGTIKKGEFLKLLMASMLPNHPYSSEPGKYNHWASSYIEAAEESEIISDGQINAENANDEITRAEVVDILGKADIIIKERDQETMELEFYDVDDMDDTAYSMLTHCVAVGYITGYDDATFKPEKTLSRAEVATILTRVLQNYEV